MSFSTTETTVARAQDVTVTEEALTVELSDGRSISAPPWYPRLLHGTPEERSNWRLIGQGNGVHWSALDEDTREWPAERPKPIAQALVIAALHPG